MKLLRLIFVGIGLTVLTGFTNPNSEAWRLLVENKPFEAEKKFTKLSKHKDVQIAAEAYRGLAEVSAYIGNSNNAAKYSFKSYTKDNNRALFAAAHIKHYVFGRTASGYKIKEGYKVLQSLIGESDVFSGNFQDLLLQRYI
ncbi:MAG: hypothetical protein HQK83_08665, partial [Fibrobacteria bacterium]|nr:hypothetical protein [Fibrobacteria bacterium]